MIFINIVGEYGTVVLIWTIWFRDYMVDFYDFASGISLV